jgi:hypothetical protein
MPHLSGRDRRAAVAFGNALEKSIEHPSEQAAISAVNGRVFQLYPPTEDIPPDVKM